ncbi:MAG: type II secretion system secretin GspD [Proteobacteria bacterium]|jgi:general secretion pathway protein D|nr:type II secretion system secretin GspD [Pseudomonadota bacterium]
MTVFYRQGLLFLLGVAAAFCYSSPAFAQEPPELPEEAEEAPPDPDSLAPERPKPPPLSGHERIKLDFVDRSLWELVEFFADLTERNFVIGDRKALEGAKVTIISHRDVSAGEAWEAFISALEVSGFTVINIGKTHKIIKDQDAAKKPHEIYTDSTLVPYTDKIITQLITLKNMSVNEVTKVITNMAPSQAKIVAYQPSNTLIITDTAHNLRKIERVVALLDIAAPQSTLAIVPIVNADAEDIKRIIEELYGTEDASKKDTRASSSRSSRSSRRSSRDPEPAVTESVTAGAEAKYISKVLADERTNSLIVLANEVGHAIIANLVFELDVDVDISSRSQIHVVRLEHAKAEEVAQVLAELSQGGSVGKKGGSKADTRVQQARARAAVARDAKGEESAAEGPTGAIAAFDSGMRIAADDNTNALIIIASSEDFEIIERVITELDVVRRQVFVDAVILEISSTDTSSLETSVHGPFNPDPKAIGFASAALGSISSGMGFSPDLLSGLAVGVFGEGIDVPMADGSTLSVPAFGIVLKAMKSNSSVNIVSNPNLLTLDNQQAKIVVGRKIPFPQQSQLSTFGQPIVSFQREDVAITLDITPRVNSSNFVTLELDVEVQEIEESESGLDVNQAGFITSTRQVKTVALVRDNQTVVLGGLVGTTDTDVETKVPVLGDLPVLGALFRGTSKTKRKTILMVFLTPHIIDDQEDMWEVMRIKEAQRQEFVRRFYGKSREKQMVEMDKLLQYSMNHIDQPSLFRGPTENSNVYTIGSDLLPHEDLPEGDLLYGEEGESDDGQPAEGQPLTDDATPSEIVPEELPELPPEDEGLPEGIEVIPTEEGQ